MKMRQCKHCKEEFPETEEFFVLSKNQFGTYLSPYCKKCYNYWCKKEGDSKAPQKEPPISPSKNKKSSLKAKKESLHEIAFNGLNGDLKAIEKYKKLSQDVVVLMRKNRISKYGVNTQNLLLDLMEACYKHLDEELHKKEVIIVDGSE